MKLKTHSPTINWPIKIALIVTIILWASAFVGIRATLSDYSPGPLALFRFIVAGVALSLICLTLPKRKRINLKDKIYLLLIGGITIGGYHLALNYGELTVPSGTASFIVSQSPIFTTLMAIIFLKERLHYMGVCGMIISIVGVFMILLSHKNQISFQINLGSFYILISAFLGSVYTISQKPFLKKYHAIEVTTYVVWGTAIILLPYAFSLHHEMLQASLTNTLWVIYLGIFPAALAYLGWSIVLARMPASRAANFLYAMPILTTFMGWLFLGEIPALLALAGGIVALLGLWVLNNSYKKLPGPIMVEEQPVSKI